MSAIKPITVGTRFERWTVLSYEGHSRYQCLCDCGQSTFVRADRLRNGQSRSCGCIQKEVATKLATTHGCARTPTYLIWRGMLQRCQNPGSRIYKYYGGRGIAICERWQKFENFAADMGERPDGLTIDRINNDGNYEPSNCRWASKKEQSQNSSRKRLVAFNGVTKNLCEWTELLQLDLKAVRQRLRNGWSPELAFTKPVVKRSRLMVSGIVLHATSGVH